MTRLFAAVVGAVIAVGAVMFLVDVLQDIADHLGIVDYEDDAW